MTFAAEALGGLAMLIGLGMLRIDREELFGIFFFGGMALSLVGFASAR